MTRTLSLSEVKTKLSELVSGIVDRDDEVVITRNGKPTAVLISAEELDSLRETLEILSDKDLMRQFRRSLASKKTKKYATLDELFGEKRK